MDKNIEVPTYFGVVCPNCQSADFQVVGQKGQQLRSITGSAGLFNVGNFRRGLSDAIEEHPLVAKCRSCKQKFMITPKVAEGEEILSEPAKFNITRQKSIMGFAVNSFIMINGVMVHSIKNGATINVETYTKHNYIQMFDQNGLAFKSEQNIVVTAGSTIDVTLTRKTTK